LFKATRKIANVTNGIPIESILQSVSDVKFSSASAHQRRTVASLFECGPAQGVIQEAFRTALQKIAVRARARVKVWCNAVQTVSCITPCVGPRTNSAATTSRYCPTFGMLKL
jgi:hypothetical protein